MKERLVSKVTGSLPVYSKTVVIVEWEKVKPGDKPKSGQRTKLMDLVVSQLAVAGIMVLYSSGQLQTASLLSDLVTQEAKDGHSLPRPISLTIWQEEMVKWISLVPGLGLATSIHLAVEFCTLRELITANISEIMRKTNIDRGKAENLVMFFMKNFQPELTDLAPL